jgi:hypothetical protein
LTKWQTKGKNMQEKRAERAEARTNALTQQIEAICLSFQDRALFDDCQILKEKAGKSLKMPSLQRRSDASILFQSTPSMMDAAHPKQARADLA